LRFGREAKPEGSSKQQENRNKNPNFFVVVIWIIKPSPPWSAGSRLCDAFGYAGCGSLRDGNEIIQNLKFWDSFNLVPGRLRAM
jgi:hypothetical protein